MSVFLWIVGATMVVFGVVMVYQSLVPPADQRFRVGWQVDGKWYWTNAHDENTARSLCRAIQNQKHSEVYMPQLQVKFKGKWVYINSDDYPKEETDGTNPG